MIVVAAIAVQRDHSVLPGVLPGTNGGAAVAVPCRRAPRPRTTPRATAASTTTRRSLATDGNAATFWRTDHYANTSFGDLKTGVGLVLQKPGDKNVKN